MGDRMQVAVRNNNQGQWQTDGRLADIVVAGDSDGWKVAEDSVSWKQWWPDMGRKLG
jgi:hypothetical protein